MGTSSTRRDHLRLNLGLPVRTSQPVYFASLSVVNWGKSMRKTLTVLAGLVLIVGIIAAPASATRPTADLIDVHHVLRAKGGARPTGNANCTNNVTSQETNKYALTGWSASGGDAHFNTATVPAGLGSVTSALQASFNAWTGAPNITVRTDGSVTRYTANRQKDLLFGKTGSSIATTYTWRWSDGLIESDVVFNSNLAWFQASTESDGCNETIPKYDVRNIATHEMGHVYGLGHPSGARFETMYAYGYTGETLKWSPTAGDRAGITAIY